MESTHIALLAVFGLGALLIVAVLLWPRSRVRPRDETDSLERDNIHFAGSSHSGGGGGID